MAEAIGEVVSWFDKRLGRQVFAIDVMVPNVAEGTRERERIYSGADATGERVAFESQMHADMVLGLIRGQIREDPNSANMAPEVQAQILTKVLARFLPARKLKANHVKARWGDFLKFKAEEVGSDDGITEKRHWDLRRMVPRGYLDFFDGILVDEITSPMLVDWVRHMKRVWPAPPAGARGRTDPTPEQRAEGVRGFHRPKTRHHIVNDFMTFENWLVTRHLVARGVPVQKPELPRVSKRPKEVPTIELLERYLAEIPEETRGIFLTRSIEGLRPNEARQLEIRHYNWRTHVLTITRDITKTDDGVREFDVDEELADWLEKWVPKSERLDRTRPLFINPKALTVRSILSRRRVAELRGLPAPLEDGRWEENAETAVHAVACIAVGAVHPDGKPLFAPNVMGRHAAVTHMLLRTEEATGTHDIEAVKRKVGHTDAATTRTYLDSRMVDTSKTRRLPKRPLRDTAEG